MSGDRAGRRGPLGIGVIGVGQRGRRHLRSVREAGAGDVPVVALADTHEPSLTEARAVLAEGPGGADAARVYRDWRELLADDAVDAAIVALPNQLHAEVAVAALQRGKHLLLEKPVALSVDDCRRIERAARDSRGSVQVGLELRYSTVARRLGDEIAAGRIGEPRLAWCHEFRAPFREKVGGWILDPARSGGTFVEKNCHHFDLLSWLLGSEPERVAAFGGREVVYREQPGILDNAWVVVEHRGGKRASLGVGMFSNVHKLEIGVLGDEGLIEGDLRGRAITIERAHGAAETIAVAGPAADRLAEHGGADLRQMEAWLDTIARAAPPQVTLADGVRSLLVALAAQRAVDTGTVVALDALAGG